MMKYISLLLLLTAFSMNAVKITKNELDEFTGQRTVITSWEGICKNYVHVRFRQQNNYQFLDFKFHSENAIVIPDQGKLMFKSTTDSISTFYSVSTYMGSKGGGSTGLIGSGVWGISATYTGPLDWFSDNLTKLIRIYATDVYYDRKVSDVDAKKLVQLYDLFSSTINNTPLKNEYADYTITFVKGNAKTNKWDKVKEDFYPNLNKEALKSIIDEWEAQTTDKVTYKVKIKKEK